MSLLIQKKKNIEIILFSLELKLFISIGDIIRDFTGNL